MSVISKKWLLFMLFACDCKGCKNLSMVTRCSFSFTMHATNIMAHEMKYEAKCTARAQSKLVPKGTGPGESSVHFKDCQETTLGSRRGLYNQ